jgi:putative methyltransferase (TIGR04325 family)
MFVLRKIYHVLMAFIVGNPVAIALRKFKYNNYFKNALHANIFNGVYRSFDEAVKSTPTTKKIGYDHDGPASMYENRLSRVFPGDYPVMFWMKKIIGDTKSLFDLGGHVGIAFYSYQKYIEMPNDYNWLVCDVPAVCNKGNELKSKKNDSRLNFTSDPANGDGFEIFFASGSLQYIDQPVSEMIASYTKKPEHIIINLLPVYDDETFVTLQNIGTAFCPYRVFNKDEFIASIKEMGYELVDIWENAEKYLIVPFQEGKELNCYHGMYFVRK